MAGRPKNRITFHWSCCREEMLNERIRFGSNFLRASPGRESRRLKSIKDSSRCAEAGNQKTSNRLSSRTSFFLPSEESEVIARTAATVTKGFHCISHDCEIIAARIRVAVVTIASRLVENASGRRPCLKTRTIVNGRSSPAGRGGTSSALDLAISVSSGGSGKMNLSKTSP